jgi:ribosomal protein L23
MFSLSCRSQISRLACSARRRALCTSRVAKATHADSVAHQAEAASKPLAVKQRIQLPDHPRLKGIILPPLKSNPTVGPSNADVGTRTRRLRGIKEGVVVGTPIFLPNIVIRMVRNKTPPGQAYNPYEATFRVPLPITKNDIKSYLLAVYGVETTYINTDIRRPAPIHRNYFKVRRTPIRVERSYKRAVVGLVEPFYYPDSYSDAGEKEREVMDKQYRLRLGLDRRNVDNMSAEEFDKLEKRMMNRLPDAQFSVGKKQREKEQIVARAAQQENLREKIVRRRSRESQGEKDPSPSEQA